MLNAKDLAIENDTLRGVIVQQQIELSLLKNVEQKPSPFFSDCYELWLKDQQPKLQSSTYHEYVSLYTRDMKPYFEKHRLKDINHEEIERFYQVKLVQGLSVHTVHRMHANLHTMFKYAVLHDYLKINPFAKVQRPKDTYQYIASYYDISQLISLFNISRNHKIFPEILLAAILGLRRSEILGLKWDSVDFNHNCLTVKRKVTRNKDIHKDEISNNLKNQSSYRTLPLPEILTTYLTNLKSTQAQRSKSANYCKTYLDYICVDDTGKLLSLNGITNCFRYIIQENGLPKIRFHDLRHSCATMLIHLGYSMKEIQVWLGHSNYNTTAKFYTHINLEDKSRMASRLNEVFLDIVQKIS